MSNSTAKLGFWSAVLSAVLSVIWFVTFNLKDLFAPMPGWQQIEAYARAFSPLRILYVYPSLLLALTFIVLMACIYRWAPGDKKIWGLIGLCLAVVYAAMASINYNIQAVAVSRSLAAGETAGIAMLLPDRPHAVFEALANSYVYMALAMVFSAFAFAGSRLQAWIRWVFLAQIVTVVGQVGWSMFGLNDAVFIATSLVWVAGAPVSFVLLALLFKRSEGVRTERAARRLPELSPRRT